MSRGIALQTYLSRMDDVRRQIEEHGSGQSFRDLTARFLGRIQSRLTRPTRIALVGEANTGKTSLANLLLGRELLITDIINNTRAPILIRYADRAQLCTIAADGGRRPVSHDNLGAIQRGTFMSLELGLPLAALKRFEIIDTPGVSVLGEDFDRMAFVCRQADMAIWCTLATQAWRASERELWGRVCERTRSSSLLAATHADSLTSTEQARVVERLQREAGPLFCGIGMLSPIENRLIWPAPETCPSDDDLATAFGRKLGIALDRVEQRRLNGARRAVQRFLGRFDGRFETRPTMMASPRLHEPFQGSMQAAS